MIPDSISSTHQAIVKSIVIANPSPSNYHQDQQSSIRHYNDEWSVSIFHNIDAMIDFSNNGKRWWRGKTPPRLRLYTHIKMVWSDWYEKHRPGKVNVNTPQNETKHEYIYNGQRQIQWCEDQWLYHDPSYQWSIPHHQVVAMSLISWKPSPSNYYQIHHNDHCNDGYNGMTCFCFMVSREYNSSKRSPGRGNVNEHQNEEMHLYNS